jgi:hypothetical protein
LGNAVGILRDTASSLSLSLPKSFVPPTSSITQTVKPPTILPTTFLSSAPITSYSSSSSGLSNQPSTPPTATSTAYYPAPTSNAHHFSKVGIIVGSVVAFISTAVLLFLGFVYRKKQRLRRQESASGGANFKQTMVKEFRRLFMDTRLVISK